MKVFNRTIKLGGQKRVINSITVQVLEVDGDGNVLRCTGTTKPTDGSAGYAKGCLFIDTDIATGSPALYENIGTTTSSSFNLVGAISAGEITLAQGSLLVGNASGVAAALSVKGDGKIIVGNGTTVTSVAVSGDITLTNAGVVALSLGSSGTPRAHTTYSDEVFAVHATCSDTDGSNSYEPVTFNTELTGAGQVGGRVLFYTKTDVVLGSWANALKAHIDFQDNGGVTGLGSAFVAEMTMPGSTPSGGNYGVIEAELNCPASFDAGSIVALSFLYLSAQGTTVSEFDDHGFLMNVQGITAGDGDLFQTGNTLANAAATLKIKVGSTTYYLPLYDGQITTS